MRRVATAFAALTAALLSTAPAAALVLWQGDATIITASTACSPGGAERRVVGVGSVFKTLYRPKGLGDNGNDSRISFTHDGQANFVLFLPNGAMPDGAYSAFGARHNGTLAANVAGTYRGFAQSPAAPAVGTVYIEYSGVVSNFMFIPGCTVLFRAAYAPRPS